MTLGADDTDELEENITEAEEVKETRDQGVQQIHPSNKMSKNNDTSDNF